MKYQYLGKTGIKVSKVAFGCQGIGGGAVWSDRSVSVEQCRSLLDAARDLGINYIDTAPVYGVGVSETILGEALKGRRDQFVVQTKCSMNWRGEGGEFEYSRDGFDVYKNHTAASIRKDVEDSMERMKLDYIDSIVVHRAISNITPVQETMSELVKMKEEGKIRAVMISKSTPEVLEEYMKYGEVSGVQEAFNLLNDNNRRFFESCGKYGMIFQVYGVLAEGALTGRAFYDRTYPKGDTRWKLKWNKEPYRAGVLNMFDELEQLCEKYQCSFANLAQAWALRQYDQLNLLTGFRRIETIQDTCRVLDIDLDEKDLRFIDECADKVRQIV